MVEEKIHFRQTKDKNKTFSKQVNDQKKKTHMDNFAQNMVV